MTIRWLDILYIFCVCLGCSSCLTTPSIRRASDVCKRGKVVHHCFLLPGRKTRHGIYLVQNNCSSVIFFFFNEVGLDMKSLADIKSITLYNVGFWATSILKWLNGWLTDDLWKYLYPAATPQWFKMVF